MQAEVAERDGRVGDHELVSARPPERDRLGEDRLRPFQLSDLPEDTAEARQQADAKRVIRRDE